MDKTEIKTHKYYQWRDENCQLLPADKLNIVSKTWSHAVWKKFNDWCDAIEESQIEYSGETLLRACIKKTFNVDMLPESDFTNVSYLPFTWELSKIYNKLPKDIKQVLSHKFFHGYDEKFISFRLRKPLEKVLELKNKGLESLSAEFLGYMRLYIAWYLKPNPRMCEQIKFEYT